MLRHCLMGLAAQQTQPAQVVVVRRDSDEETAKAIAESPIVVTEVVVSKAGVLAALVAGAAASTEAIVAFTDDDAVARPEWLSVLLTHYTAPTVGGVGGRDVVPSEAEPTVASHAVGQISAWGRTTGGHHLGYGPATQVDVLKGVNMSFRREALALPTQLRGEGAQVHNEIYVSLWVAAQGWHLIYDPAALVDHYVGPRFDEDGRDTRSSQALADEAFNLVWALTGLRPHLRWRRAAFGVLIGDRATPGLVRGAVALLRRERNVVRYLGPSLRGQIAALRAVARGHRPNMVSPNRENG